MSINRQTIKRLERELEKLTPKTIKRAICEEKDGLFYYDERVYRTTDELVEKEGIRDRLLILDV